MFKIQRPSVEAPLHFPTPRAALAWFTRVTPVDMRMMTAAAEPGYGFRGATILGSSAGLGTGGLSKDACMHRSEWRLRTATCWL